MPIYSIPTRNNRLVSGQCVYLVIWHKELYTLSHNVFILSSVSHQSTAIISLNIIYPFTYHRVMHRSSTLLQFSPITISHPILRGPIVTLSSHTVLDSCREASCPQAVTSVFRTFLFKIHLSTNHPSTPHSPTWSIILRFSDLQFSCISPYSQACYVSCTSAPLWPNKIRKTS
jgi:hypothetical protein